MALTAEVAGETFSKMQAMRSLGAEDFESKAYSVLLQDAYNKAKTVAMRRSFYDTMSDVFTGLTKLRESS